jgi:protein-S-isoprenylcysteine O-methyltransferase Ste14
LVYALLARREETKMVEQFGTRYEAYRRRIPMFFPKLNQWGRLLSTTDSNPGADE